MRQTLQIPITNIIFHYITCDAVQKRRIEATSLLFGGINIKIITENPSPLPLLRMRPKVTNVFEELLPCRLIFLKALFE